LEEPFVDYALTVYPLSNLFRSRLKDELASEPVWLSLAELRRLPLADAIARLRSLDGARLVIQLEDESSRSILPVLKAVAALSNARLIEVRDMDFCAERITRSKLLLGLASLSLASAVAARDALSCSRDLSRLLTAPRSDVSLGDSGAALYLNANLWFGVKAGGSIGHVAGVINAMKDRALEVVYASAGGRTMIRSDIPLIELMAPKVFSLPYELNYYAFHRMVISQLERIARPRFVYHRMSIANYAGVKLSRGWRVPLILEYNGSEVWVARNWGLPLRYHGLAARAEEACLRHAHVVVTVSAVLRDELVEKGVSPERIVCYPNCIDPVVFDPARFSAADSVALRRKLGIAPDAVVATFIGTFGHWHGAEVLARAIRRLVDTHHIWLDRKRVHFLLVGDGLRMPMVRDILEGAETGRFVTLTGLVAQAEAPSFLAASDVLLSPHVGNADGTRFFGSPTKLFEYMAMGKAIVASDLDQIGQVLQNSVRVGDLPAEEPAEGETRLGVLSPPGDVTALVDSIMFSVDRPDWRRTLAKNARAEALAKYTWSHHVEAIFKAVSSFGTGSVATPIQ
jgi:glycosyltransferase involved in cell wall biosynthesis